MDGVNFFSSKTKGASQFWQGLHKVKHLFKWGVTLTVGDGRNCRFWQDSWLYEVPLKIHCEDLFKWLEILNALFLIAGLNRIGLLISEDLYPTLSFRYGLYYMMNFNTFH